MIPKAATILALMIAIMTPGSPQERYHALAVATCTKAKLTHHLAGSYAHCVKAEEVLPEDY